MTRCGRGPVVFWLLTMLFTGVSFCMCSVCAEDRGRSGTDLDGRIGEQWRDWLPLENGQPSPLDDTSLLIRRITPKSVFVAPNFSGCSDGYRQDGMGRCVKLVKVNQAAQLDFILQKLNSKFASTSNANKNDDKSDSGPFHVSLSLGVGSFNNNNKNNVYNSNSNNNNNTREEETQMNSTTHAPPVEYDTTTPIAYTESTMMWVTPALSTHANTNTKPSFDNVSAEMAWRRPPTVPYLNYTDYQSFENTVKRQPPNTDKENDQGRPFIIVVANNTGVTDYSGFNLLENLSQTIRTTTQTGFPLDELSASTDFRTESDIYTSTTYKDSPGEIQFNNSETTTSENFYTGNESNFEITPSTLVTLSVENGHQSTSVTTNIEELGTSSLEDVFSDVVSLNISTEKMFTDTSASTTIMPVPNVQIEDQTDGREDIKYLIPVTEENQNEDVYDDKELSVPDKDSVSNHNKNDQGLFQVSLSQALFGLQDGTRTTENCENVSDLQTTQISYGRVVNTNSVNINCHPSSVTTVSNPVQTTTPTPKQSLSYYVRFPVDSDNSKPYSSYSSSSFADDKKKTGLVRFPNHPSVLSSYRPMPYGSKFWNTDDGMSSSSTSTGLWYSPPSWFPFLQSQNNWMSHNNHNSNYNDNDMNRPLSVSAMYHKQYVNYRPSASVHIPTWVNRHVSWPKRD